MRPALARLGWLLCFWAAGVSGLGLLAGAVRLVLPH